VAEDDIVYCFDTSSFVQLRHYPRRTFLGIWNRLEELVRAGRLVAPDEVLRELERGTDNIAAWAKQERDMFRPIDQQLYTVFRDVVNDFPALVDEKKESPDADAFVVSVARLIGQEPQGLFGPPRCVVVTQEVRSQARRKIPDACSYYGIDCVDLLGFFEMEDLEFS
jgi:hypothetical protein